MANVINISDKIQDKRNTESFLNIIANDVEEGHNIEPIDESVFSRMATIEAAAQKAKEKRELFEG